MTYTRYHMITHISMQGYKQKKCFIIAQAPMENTIRDFWKMVSNRECGVIIMLSELEEEGEEVCAKYWPTDGNAVEYGEYLVTTQKVHKNEGYTQRQLTLTHPKVRSTEIIKAWSYIVEPPYMHWDQPL